MIEKIDTLIARGGAFDPYWGWHDDHRDADGTADYLPALQQVRSEYVDLLEALSDRPRGRCLQLGMGECDASHEAWRLVFDEVVTLDWGKVVVNDYCLPGVDVGSSEAAKLAAVYGPYDFLFIDAGHREQDAWRDHDVYGVLVRPGGIVAFHDALRRPGFEEAVQVWRYLETLPAVNLIGREVGVAWVIR